MENVYSSKETHQGLPSGGSTFEQVGDRRASFVRTICVAVAIVLGAGLGTFPAFADTNPSLVRFYYGFPGGSGWVDAQDPIASGITFSGLSLRGVGEHSGPAGSTLFGPWPTSLAPGWPNNPSDPYMSFTIFAPSGYQLSAGFLSAQTSGGIVTFAASGPGTSEEIKVGVQHFSAYFPNRPLSDMTGVLTLAQVSEPSVVPEPSTVVGGIAAAGLVLVFFLRRLTRGRSSTAFA